MPMSETDWNRMNEVHDTFREIVDKKVDKEDCVRSHEGDKGLSRAVEKNSTDITWLKRSHAAVVTVAGSVTAALILWAVFGGG
jgi:hypothetical protein